MKMYGLLLLILVVGLAAGCSQATPSGTTTTRNNQNSQDYTPSNNMMNNPPSEMMNTTNDNPQGNMMNNTNPGGMMQDPGISIAQLATHNSGSNCWVAYKSKVYDITKFLPIHPGGANRIIPYCGTSTQFEQAFTRQHGTSQVGRLIQQGIYEGDLQ